MVLVLVLVLVEKNNQIHVSKWCWCWRVEWCCLLLLGSLDGSLPAELGPVWWVVVLGSLDDISLGRAWVSMSGSAA